MNKPPIICLDCGVDITEIYYSDEKPCHNCNKRIRQHTLQRLGAEMVEPDKNSLWGGGGPPYQIWEYKGRKMIKYLSSSTDPDDTYLYDKETKQMLSLEDLK